MPDADQSKEASPEAPQAQPKGLAIPIRFVVDPRIRPTFANHFTLQRDGNHVFMQFFELSPPMLLGTDEENEKKLTQMQHLDANCVGRIVMGEQDFESMVDAIEKVRKKMKNE